MKILFISDEESAYLWEHYTQGKLADYDLMISCGDLDADYLSFLVTMGRAPLLYVHGNHDYRYAVRPPEGCDCIDDQFVIYNGLRILGLGGSYRYHPGDWQYTEREMRRRIRRLQPYIRRAGGIDLVVTHAPVKGAGDGEDPAHRGFQAFGDLLDRYQPAYLAHGHVHLCYGANLPRVQQRGKTAIINACGRFVLEIPEPQLSVRRTSPRLRKILYENWAGE